jgi:glycosyltransferase involved in cell wall biosynthesis
MNLVIDASNIKAGGGLIHLLEVLRHSEPLNYGFETVVICAPTQTLEKIANKPGIRKHSHKLINGNYIQQWIWRRFILPKLLVKVNAFLFTPGAIKPPFKWPYVTMCQNLLPLEYRELLRYKISIMTLRLLILRYMHIRAYEYARGVIFLTNYCHNILRSLKCRTDSFRIISHGLNSLYFQPTPLKAYVKNGDEYFEMLYVSVLDVYKHQDKVISAVVNLNRIGYKVRLTLAGPAYPPSKARIENLLSSLHDAAGLVSYIGLVPYESLPKVYSSHHAFIFASTCETFGMIITEAMAMAMPILCTSRSSLKETVQDAAVYFDPLDVSAIERAIERLINDQSLRAELAVRALRRSKHFSWKKCADETFEFLAEAARTSGF